MKLVTYLAIMIGFLSVTKAQETMRFVSPLKYEPLQNKIYIERDTRIDTLLNRQFINNQLKGGLNGYRIQISSSKNRDRIYELKGEIYKYFPDMESYVDYQQPNFKLRLGNFRNKMDAMRSLEEVKEFYTSAFLVRENIPFKAFNLETDRPVAEKEDEGW